MAKTSCSGSVCNVQILSIDVSISTARGSKHHLIMHTYSKPSTKVMKWHVAIFAINTIHYSFFLPHAHMLDHMYSIWSCLTACDHGQSYRWPVCHSLSVALASIWLSWELALWTAEFLFRSGTHLSSYWWLGFSLSTISSEHFTSPSLWRCVSSGWVDINSTVYSLDTDE